MRFEQVRFRYARRGPWTLHDVDATVHPGETVVVLGRNGAGKSTLLQLAAGVLRPVGGRVTDRPAVVGWVPERFPERAAVHRPYLPGAHGAAPRPARPGRGRPLAGAAAIGRARRHPADRSLQGHRAEGRPGPGTAGPAGSAGTRRAVGRAGRGRPEFDPGHRRRGHRGRGSGSGQRPPWRDQRAARRDPLDRRPTPRSDRRRQPDEDPGEVVIEFAVSRADADDAVARLRADGHRVLGVRAR